MDIEKIAKGLQYAAAVCSVLTIGIFSYTIWGNHKQKQNIYQTIKQIEESLNIPFFEETLDSKVKPKKQSRESTEKEINIGLAMDESDNVAFDEAIYQANKTLKKYGLHVVDGETVNISLPNSFNTSEMLYGVKNAFSTPQDYYFVQTRRDLKLGKKNYGIQSLTKRRLTMIDDEINKRDLSKIISQEIIRLFSNKEEMTVDLVNLNDYLQEIPISDVEPNLDKILIDDAESGQDLVSSSPYDTASNYVQPRSVDVSIALDGVSESKAIELISKVNKNYKFVFNISFNPYEFFVYSLPEKWNTNKEMEKVREKSSKEADIYLLLTDRIFSKKSSVFSTLGGEANKYCGFSWVSVVPDYDNTVKVLEHELGHLFNARHIYLPNAVMHPHAGTVSHPLAREDAVWSEKTIETILENKFRTWDWSYITETKK